MKYIGWGLVALILSLSYWAIGFSGKNVSDWIVYVLIGGSVIAALISLRMERLTKPQQALMAKIGLGISILTIVFLFYVTVAGNRGGF